MDLDLRNRLSRRRSLYLYCLRHWGVWILPSFLNNQCFSNKIPSPFETVLDTEHPRQSQIMVALRPLHKTCKSHWFTKELLRTRLHSDFSTVTVWPRTYLHGRDKSNKTTEKKSNFALFECSNTLYRHWQHGWYISKRETEFNFFPIPVRGSRRRSGKVYSEAYKWVVGDVHVEMAIGA